MSRLWRATPPRPVRREANVRRLSTFRNHPHPNLLPAYREKGPEGNGHVRLAQSGVDGTRVATACRKSRPSLPPRSGSGTLDCREPTVAPDNRMPPTLNDIARETNTSVSTVSRVLAGGTVSQRISTATRGRVLAAAKAMGYRPNLMARGLRTRQSKTIALLVSDIANPFFSQIGSLVEQSLHR